MIHDEEDDQGERLINEGMKKARDENAVQQANVEKSTRHGRKTALFYTT
jgi:hypothetical protein